MSSVVMFAVCLIIWFIFGYWRRHNAKENRNTNILAGENVEIMIPKVGFIFKDWGISGDYVIVGKEKINPVDIRTVDFVNEAKGLKNGVVQITMKSGKFYTLGYKSSDREKAHQVIQWITEHSSDEVAKAKIENREFHCRCTLCGKVWSFNMEDLERNELLAKTAKRAAFGANVSALSGVLGAPVLSAQVGTYANSNAVDSAVSQIKDYLTSAALSCSRM